ncbi:ATP-binding protein [Rhizobium phaseoli]|uniref:ATP-binding protein n=1 Tax=Rhizobium phaseoli TaxID=396 RepID=UPI0007EABA43|nr:HAMP domain-containing sensor histidine kinase [Rhizobium phaseoli]
MRLKETLEALLPPHDRGDFDIFVHDDRVPEQSGFIDNFPPDQFDYRMLTTVSADGNVEITLQRQEIDVARISPTFFTLEPMKKFPYRKSDFEAGQITYSKRLEELLDPGDELEAFLALGPFSFNFYFFKLNNATADNLARFPQKNFDVSARRRWLNSSGGIRLYRDNFRVRPYGEPKSTSYDWLSIGERSARNPVQASRPGWRVLPQQIAGTIHITKRENSLLSDQSNREGIVNERAFSGFRKIIVALIKEFEKDRAYILQHFSIAYDQDNPEPMDVEEGRKIAEKVLEDENAPPLKGNNPPQLELGAGFSPAPSPSVSETDLRKVSKAYGSERKKNEVLRDNIQVMRGMATLGTVLVSFTHELRQIRANIDARSQRLADAIQQVVSDEKLASVDELSSPFRILDRLKKQDEKVTRWVNFALSAVSPSKRRRRRIDLSEYLQGVRIYWDDFLQSRSIAFTTYAEAGADLSILAHEIDLDSIFYNLINNSVEALVKPTSSSRPREIAVNITAGADDGIVVDYRDSGPGLSGEFTIAEDIFLFGVTSKKEEANGEAVGTGLGMWLLKNVVDDYGGTASLKSELGKPGFAISIRLPAPDADE